MNFSQLGLAPAQVRSCESLGYTGPTPIQQQGIPVVLNGQDLIGCAETGTGKTAAFLLPLIQRMTEKTRPGVRILVLAPTRELAMQIQKNYGELNRVKANRGVTVIGGANIRTQIADLRRGVAIVIATPGRLLDLAERGAINFSVIEVLVLDEADRMLDMGFLPAIRRILSMVPTKRQTLLFSATMSSDIEKLARTTMKDPKLVEVSPRGQAATMVEQTAYPAAQNVCRTFFPLGTTALIVFTLIARSHSVRRRYADSAMVAHACWLQLTLPRAVWMLTRFHTS